MAQSRPRATMKDVARLADVSPKTVSNVLTRTVTVSPATRARVEAAMGELDFVPNYSARGLRNGRTGMIGVALADLATPFSASISHHLIDAAHSRGLAVQMEETASDPQREHDLVTRAQTHLVDGLILNPVRLKDSVVEHLQHLPPLVLIGEVEQHRTDRVYVASRRASREITGHVIDQGARKVVALGTSGALDAGATATKDERTQGYVEALTEAGLPVLPELQASAPAWTIAGGAAGIRRLIDQSVEFDAVVAFTDSLALGALHALHAAGVQVPRQVLVTGFDDVEHAAFVEPPLTTVHFDHQAYAEAAMELLHTRIENRSLAPRAVKIEHTLAVRRSSSGRPEGFPSQRGE